MSKKNVIKRKTNFIISLVILQIVGFSFSDCVSLKAQPLYLGIKGGWGLPQLSGGTNEISKDWKSRTAFNFGVLGSCEISENLAIQMEVNYASQGGRKNGIQPISEGAIQNLPSGMTLYADFKNRAILNYIEVPVLARWMLLKGNTHYFYLNAGPYFGYLIYAHNKTAGMSSIFVDKNGTILMIPNPENPGQYIPLPAQNFDADVTIHKDIKSFNFGFTGGVAVAQSLGQGNLFLDIRGCYGLKNIQKDPVNGKNNTGALVLSLGYALKII